jgi:hypothetical protein
VDDIALSRLKHLPLIPGWTKWDWQGIFSNSNHQDSWAGVDPPAPEEIDQVLHQYTSDDGSGDYQDTDMAAVLRLKDGTFASVQAATDTTGWGCHGDMVRWYMGPTLEDVIYNGLTNESRDWLGLEIERDA